MSKTIEKMRNDQKENKNRVDQAFEYIASLEDRFEESMRLTRRETIPFDADFKSPIKNNIPLTIISSPSSEIMLSPSSKQSLAHLNNQITL